MNGAHRQYTIDMEKKERFNIKTILCETKMEQIHDINNHNNPKIANLRSRVYFEEWRQQMSYLNEREMHVKSETELELEQEREKEREKRSKNASIQNRNIPLASHRWQPPMQIVNINGKTSNFTT